MDMAIRRRWALRLNGFRSDLEMNGRTLGRGEETDLFLRTRRKGRSDSMSERRFAGIVMNLRESHLERCSVTASPSASRIARSSTRMPREAGARAAPTSRARLSSFSKAEAADSANATSTRVWPRVFFMIRNSAKLQAVVLAKAEIRGYRTSCCPWILSGASGSTKSGRVDVMPRRPPHPANSLRLCLINVSAVVRPLGVSPRI
jgi:hypothetical protein